MVLLKMRNGSTRGIGSILFARWATDEKSSWPNNYRAAREDALFNLGFEHAASARPHGLLWRCSRRTASRRPWLNALERAGAVLALHAEVVSREGAAALLEIAGS